MFPIDTDDINIVPIIEKRQILQTIQYTAFIINHAKELNWGVSLKHTHVHTHTFLNVTTMQTTVIYVRKQG